MNRRLPTGAPLAFGLLLIFGSSAWSFDDELPNQLTLADLSDYRAALVGKAIEGGPEQPKRVTFRQLSSQAAALRGRRVIVEGRLERVFRQGPVGTFPALAEIWIASPAGDPFCLVAPQAASPSPLSISSQDPESPGTSTPRLELGSNVAFTGTFLKMVRYAAGDRPRLAPLIVGNQAPTPVKKFVEARPGNSQPGDDHFPSTPSTANWVWALVFGLVTAGMFAWRYGWLSSVRGGYRQKRPGNRTADSADPPLEFIEPPDKTVERSFLFNNGSRDTSDQVQG